MAAETHLQELLSQWDQHRAEGRDVPPAELCRERPELLPELQRRIALLAGMDKLAAGAPTEPFLNDTQAPNEAAASISPHGWPVTPGYEILGLLGRGGMGVVYKARDVRRGEVLALKTFQALEPGRLLRFKNEFRALAGVTHPNLVSLYDLYSEGETWFFTMELVDGVPLHEHVGKGSNKDRLRDCLAQLAEGLLALHGRGLLHRDVKPSNALVTSQGRVVLLDFGLAAELDVAGLHESTEQNLLGTVPYMAPEQAACRPLTPAADWYSVGVILYQALAGRLPFQGSVLQVLQEKQHHQPPAPRALNADVPEDLDALCCELLRVDPAARPGGEEVLRRFKGARVVRPRAEAAAPLFLCRDLHLAALGEAFAALRQGRPLVVEVAGRSGTGKSTLLHHFLESLSQHRDVVTLQGRCYQHESVPFKGLDSVVDALSRHWKRLPRDRAAELLPRDVEPLLRVFPILGRVDAVAEAPRRKEEEIDPEALRRRAFTALREVLARLADRSRLVLAIDDLQWGDLDSVRLLSAILSPPEPPVLLLLCCYRSDEAEISPCLLAFQEALGRLGDSVGRRRVEVEPLAVSEAALLAERLLGGAAGAAHAERIARDSGGNLFFVHELAQQALLATATDGQDGSSAAPALDEVLWSRIERLPEQARRLLEVLAVAGRPRPVCDVGAAADLPVIPRAVQAALQQGRLIAVTGQADQEAWGCYHDRVREAVLNHLPPPVLALRHRRLAEVLEAAGAASSPSDFQHLFDIASHFDTAGESSRALPYALAAAERARAQCSLEAAERQYLIAERGGGAAAPDVRLRIAEGLGNVLMLRGRYDAAQVRLELARDLAVERVDRSRLLGQLGELAFKRGDVQAAAEATEGALRLLGQRAPRRPLGFALAFAWERLCRQLHRWLPTRFLPRRALEGAATDLLAIRLYNRLCYAYWFGRGTLACFFAHFRSLNLAERYPPTPELAYLYATHGVAMSLLGRYDRGVAYLEKSLALRRSFHDGWGEGQALNFCCILLYAAARYEESLDKARQARELLNRMGDPWEANLARYHTAVSLYRLGRLREAVQEGRVICDKARELGDVQLVRFGLDVRAKASGGRIPEAELRVALGLPEHDVQSTSQALQAEGTWHLSQGRIDQAVQAFERAVEVARRVGMRNMHTTPALAWLVTALRQQADHLSENDPRRSAMVRRRAESAAARAFRQARHFPCDGPHVLRELGLLLWVRKRLPQALRRLDEGLALALGQGAHYEHAQTLLARARLAAQLHLPEAAEQEAAARTQLRALESPRNEAG